MAKKNQSGGRKGSNKSASAKTQENPTVQHDDKKTPAPAQASASTTSGEKNYSEEYRKKMTALPIHFRLSTKLRRALGRLGQYAKGAARFDAEAVRLEPKIEGAPEGVDALSPSDLIRSADAGLQKAVEMLERIDEKYEAPRKLGGAAAANADKGETASKFAANMTVAIREKRRAAYADDLTVAEMAKLTVVEPRKNKVICVTAGGAKVFIPKAHLEPVVSDDEQAQESDAAAQEAVAQPTA